jgi:HlyD family secretion protein
MTGKRWIAIFVITAVVLVSCNTGSSTSDITPIITAPPAADVSGFRPTRGGVSASGVVVPARFARLGHTTPTTIEAVEVELGDTVKFGQTLIRFQGQAGRDTAIAAAELEMLSAQQALDQIFDQAGQVAGDVQIQLARAREALNDAERIRTNQQEGNRGSSTTIKAAEAEVAVAKAAMERAESNYGSHSHLERGDPERAQAYKNYAAANQRYWSALASLNWYTGHPTELQQSLLDAEVAKAAADVETLEQVREKVRDGPDPDVQAATEARLKLAEAQLKSAQEAAQNDQIQAPFDGIVAELAATPGEIAVPGQALVVIADLDHLQVETNDLSERDVNRVSVGLPAEIFIEALGIAVPGRVVRIASSATKIGGDVVYAVTLDLEEQPDGLLWGMSAEVEIEVD